MNKLLLSTLVSLLIFAGISSSAFAEGMILFPDQSLMDLTLVDTEPETGFFSFLDRYGELHDGSTGDLIGIEEVIVLEVHDISIVVVSYEEYEGYDWDGSEIIRTRTNVQTISRARMMEGGKGVR